MFGKESAGIPEELLAVHEASCIRIPMQPSIRSLNLSNSVAIVLYEALRHESFFGNADRRKAAPPALAGMTFFLNENLIEN